MEVFEVRIVELHELPILVSISKATFIETFSAVNTPENMQQYLAENLNTAQLKSELENPDAEFYFALSESKVIGYLKLNFRQAQTELKHNDAIEIERIYVLKKYHGTGVGQLLFKKALQIAKHKGAPYIWLGVWEENLKAIQFYKKNGFVEFGNHIFKLGEDVQTDIMMKLELNIEEG